MFARLVNKLQIERAHAENKYQLRERNMAKTEKRPKKPKKVKATDIQEYLKKLPPPPEEHAYELKMEKRLKHMLEEQEKKKRKKNHPSAF